MRVRRCLVTSEICRSFAGLLPDLTADPRRARQQDRAGPERDRDQRGQKPPGECSTTPSHVRHRRHYGYTLLDRAPCCKSTLRLTFPSRPASLSAWSIA